MTILGLMFGCVLAVLIVFVIEPMSLGLVLIAGLLTMVSALILNRKRTMAK
jgi:hypothetical protein